MIDFMFSSRVPEGNGGLRPTDCETSNSRKEASNMTIALTLERYLDAKNVKYDLIAHPPTHSSGETAEICHIPGDCLAKGVVLRDEIGYALAVLPASHHIRLAELRRKFGDDVNLASEREIEELFGDCARGAVPAIGECYGLDMLVDDSLDGQPEVYFEGGDHATLVHMTHAQFAQMTAAARHGAFSEHHWCQV
jgi:Ala-tRNA(Pro) deacylase